MSTDRINSKGAYFDATSGPIQEPLFLHFERKTAGKQYFDSTDYSKYGTVKLQRPYLFQISASTDQLPLARKSKKRSYHFMDVPSALHQKKNVAQIFLERNKGRKFFDSADFELNRPAGHLLCCASPTPAAFDVLITKAPGPLQQRDYENPVKYVDSLKQRREQRKYFDSADYVLNGEIYPCYPVTLNSGWDSLVRDCKQDIYGITDLQCKQDMYDTSEIQCFTEKTVPAKVRKKKSLLRRTFQGIKKEKGKKRH